MVSDMAAIYDCTVPAELLAGMRLARAAISRGELAVIPTDTVYGIAADAFTPAAVQRLLDAKGRTRQSPPPVLIPNLATLDALAEHVSDAVRSLAEAFWPGGLTIVVDARSSLMWDLGETDGTVALRMPADPIALELLAETGPLAVSSANLTGQPAALDAAEAQRMLGDSVEVYLQAAPPVVSPDGAARTSAAPTGTAPAGTPPAGTAPAGTPPAGTAPAGTAPAGIASTIIDATDPEHITIIRHGVITEQQLRAVIGDALITASAEPAVPAESTASAEPAVPAEPMAPAERAMPAEPAAPAESAASAEGTAPAESTASAEGTASAESTASAEGTAPAESTASAEPTPPTPPAAPADSSTAEPA
ncbi:MAG: translation factor [Subtercola sp.]|nr:translation factor [Subtercola sp.]